MELSSCFLAVNSLCKQDMNNLEQLLLKFNTFKDITLRCSRCHQHSRNSVCVEKKASFITSKCAGLCLVLSINVMYTSGKGLAAEC